MACSDAHDTYNSIAVGSDRKVYYTLSSAEYLQGGKSFRYTPSTGEVETLGDLTEVCGDLEPAGIPQGKSHVPYWEDVATRTMYYGTHIGWYVSPRGWRQTCVRRENGYRATRVAILSRPMRANPNSAAPLQRVGLC